MFSTKMHTKSNACAGWHQLYVAILLLLYCIRNGAAIKCFVCDSSDNPSCADLQSNASIVAEECTLTKIRSIRTWLFDLNRFEYFEAGNTKGPLMNCQKVVARNPNTFKMVTARFCQLDTADSDSCVILENRLRKEAASLLQSEEAPAEQFHCSICNTDSCNTAARLQNFMAIGLNTVLTAILALPLRAAC